MIRKLVEEIHYHGQINNLESYFFQINDMGFYWSNKVSIIIANLFL